MSIFNQLDMVVERITRTDEEDAKKNKTESNAAITSAKDIDRLILNHSLSATKAAELVGMNRVAFKDYILDAEKRGVIDGVLKTSNQYRYTLRHIHAIMDDLNIPAYKDIHSKTQIIVNQNLKGGTGKSTAGINLSAALALDLRERKRVLIIDLDPQGSQSQFSNINPEEDDNILTAVDLMLGQDEPESLYSEYINAGYSHEDIVRNAMVETHLPNLDVLPAFPTDERFNSAAWMAYAEDYKSTGERVIKHISRLKECVIDVIRDDYDFIIIDTAPQLNPLVWSAQEASNGLLIPCTPHTLDWKATRSLLKMLKDMLQQLPSGGENLEWFKVVGANYDDEHRRDDFTLGLMNNELGSVLLNNQIKRSTAFESAAREKMTVLDIRKSDALCPPKQLEKAVASLKDVSRELDLFLGEYK
ncbi:ParA family protein [Pseudoalteromonas ruthenica]|uniref:ParA family protein n=1 Tax=Pseudoalteromonas ruthenica TaxID=151081 RepID=UPI00110A724C|nr:ParA family protein [Pseudoalteromonas ruthenica]TMO87675.1 ParA family protein [Pseudoalteromonas ruthenica]TMP22248.1 ParA family protein [Pseudoalteromonas ruthenica]